MSLKLSLLALVALPFAVACGSVDSGVPGEDDTVSPGTEGDEDSRAESDLTTLAEAKRICLSQPAPKPWTREDLKSLTDEVVRVSIERKRANDKAIRERGIGIWVGIRTEVGKALDAKNYQEVARLIQPKLKSGFNALDVAKSMKTTFCIGFTTEVLELAYAKIGRASEAAALTKCTIASDWRGNFVQQALMKNGWMAPAVGFISDSKAPPGNTDDERARHKGFLRMVQRGSYFDVALSKTALIKDFLPTPGSATVRDDSAFVNLGKSPFLAYGLFREGYHVPFVIPAALAPDEFANAAGVNSARFLDSKRRGEPFIIESHSLRGMNDPTNFEIRPLRDAMEETLDKQIVYGSGTLVFAPFSQGLPQ
jgi:hypothetical protein